MANKTKVHFHRLFIEKKIPSDNKQAYFCPGSGGIVTGATTKCKTLSASVPPPTYLYYTHIGGFRLH